MVTYWFERLDPHSGTIRALERELVGPYNRKDSDPRIGTPLYRCLRQQSRVPVSIARSWLTSSKRASPYVGTYLDRPCPLIQGARETTSHMCYSRRMTEVASRQLRNRTRALLDRVAAGEHITITVDGRAVARLVPPEPRPRWMPREVFVARVLGHQADPGMAADLAELAPDTTADLPL